MRNVNLFSVKSKMLKLFVFSIFTYISSLSSQTNLISPTGDGGFETGGTLVDNGWTGVASTQTWRVGTVAVTAPSLGTNMAYTSTTAGSWTPGTSASVAHIYRNITIPSGETNLTVTLKYKTLAVDATFDFIKVHVVPTSTTPVAGTQLATGQLGVNTDGTTSYATYTFSGVVSDGAQRLVISFKTDAASPYGAAAIDEISVTSSAPAPICNSQGIFTIDNTLSNNAGTSGGNFSSFTNAINYINFEGICGPLTLNVAAGQTFTENPPALTATGTLTNQLIFQKSGVGANPKITPTGTAGSTDFGFCISGGDYITINGVDIDASAGSAVEYGYLVRNVSATDGAQNNTIQNVSINLGTRAGSNSSYGIFQTATTTGGGFTPTNATGANSGNKYYNLSISNVRNNGIYLLGNATFRDIACEVGTTVCNNRNTIINIGPTVSTSTGAYGIQTVSQENCKIFNTDISGIAGNQSASYGVYMTTNNGNCELYNNRCENVSVFGSTSTSSATYGIRVDQSTSGTHNTRIYNSVVSNLFTSRTSVSSTRYVFGIWVGNTSATSAQSYDIDNNSVSIGQGMNIAISSSCLEVQNNGSVYRIRGNIFANFTASQGATAKHYAVRFTGATWGATGSVCNFNNYYIANDLNTSGFISLVNAANNATLAAHQAALTSPGTQDVNSLTSDPQFVNNNNDLHLSASTLNAVFSFTTQAWVTTDIECADRSTASPSDLGAYVINTCASADGGTITPASQSKCTGQTATMSSVGASTGSGITHQWKVSSTSGSGYINVTGGSGAITTSYTSDPLTAGTYYYVLETTCSAGPTTDLSNELTVTVNALPTVTVLPTSGSLCSPGGTPITLTAGGASTYTWNPTSGLAPTSGSPVDADPSSTTIYTVTGTDGNGCTNTAQATITVNDKPSTVTISPSNVLLCSNQIQLLTASGGTGTGTIGTGTSFTGATEQPTAFCNRWTSYSMQTIYTAAELLAAGYVAGNLTSLSYNVSSLGDAATNAGFTVKIGHEGSIVNFPSTSFLTNAGYTTVYGPLTFPHTASGWQTITFSSPFIWDGINNICIDVRHSGANSINNAQTQFTTTAGNTTLYSTSSLTPVTGTLTTTRLNIRLGGLPSNPITWLPITDLYTDVAATVAYTGTSASSLYVKTTSDKIYTATATNGAGCTNSGTSMVTISAGASITVEPVSDSKCEGQTATFTVGATGPSLTYQWRKGGIDIPIGGNASAGTATLSLTNVMAGDAATYDVVVSAACGIPVMSNGTSTLTVNAIPTASASNDGPKCVGADLNLTGTHSGGSTFAWTGPASYSANTQNASRSTLTLAHSGTYTFTATSAAGCTSDPATTSVTINATPSAISIAPSGPVVLCATSPAELLTATGGLINSFVTFNSGNINLAIPDNSSTGINNTLSVSGIPAGATIDSVIVNFNVTHEFASDVELNLEAPNGQITNLMADRGSLSILGFVNTYASSDISKPAFSSGSAPFTGTFKADLTAQANLIGSPVITTQTFSDLFSTFNGNWKIRAYDDANGDVGTLVNWSIKIAYTAPTTTIWSPIAGLYTDDIATIAYTGTPTNMVYAKPVATETYTVTASTETQFTFDGTINESGWGAALATSAGGPSPSFGAGQEINALYVQGGDKVINIGIAGDVQNGNRILLFIDSKTGGYTNGSFGRTGAPQGIDDFNSGTTFDTGFEADYCLVIGTNGPHDNFFFDLYTLSAGGGPAVYLGDISDPKIGADPLTASNTRGFEIAIAKALLGYTSGNIKVFAAYSADDGTLSNQFLTRAGSGDGNYGNGMVTFGSAMPDPITVPLTNLQSYCTSTAMVIVGIEGTVVKNSGDSGLHSLRSVYGCIADSDIEPLTPAITYDQEAMPTPTSTSILTSPLNITKSVTIKGLSDSARPIITVPPSGLVISTAKTLTLDNVDISSTGEPFDISDGALIIKANSKTVVKKID